MSRKSVLATLTALLTTAVVFWIWPGLDLAVSRWFFADGAFVAATPAGRAYRFFFYWLPAGVMLLGIVAYGLRKRGLATWPTGRALAFMAISMALGPGLLINLGLKDHMHRPRPTQVVEFGGSLEFRPWWRTDGGCASNCSFASGEAATAAWLIAPASLAPPPLRLPVMGAALAAMVLTSGGRVAIGGHFLSDVLFATFLTILVTQGLRRLMLGREPS